MYVLIYLYMVDDYHKVYWISAIYVLVADCQVIVSIRGGFEVHVSLFILVQNC